MPRSGGLVWVTGWRPETGEAMTAQIPADRVPPPLTSSPLELSRFEPSPQFDHLALKLLDQLVRNDAHRKGG
jgi:hypothetical protein